MIHCERDDDKFFKLKIDLSRNPVDIRKAALLSPVWDFYCVLSLYVKSNNPACILIGSYDLSIFWGAEGGGVVLISRNGNYIEIQIQSE